MSSLKIHISSLESGMVMLLAYIYVYNPPFSFLPVTPNRFLWILAFSYISLKGLWGKYLYSYRWELLFFAVIIFLSFFLSVKNAEGFYICNVNVITFFDTLILGFWVKQVIANRDSTIILLKIGIIASLISLLLIFIPPLSDFVRANLRLDGNFDSGFLQFRSYGLSENLTFGYGLVQGLILVLCLNRIRINYHYVFFVPAIFISILFNARTGFVPVILYVAYIIFIFRSIKFLLYLLLFTSLFIGALLYLPIFEGVQETVQWGLDFFTQLYDFVAYGNDSESNTLNYLFSEMFVFPETISGIFWGDGAVVKDVTDVGYFQQINFGGILYCLIWVSFFLYIFHRWKQSCPDLKWFINLLMLSLFISNIKGNAFVTTPFLRTIILLYMSFMPSLYKTRKEQDESTVSYQ